MNSDIKILRDLAKKNVEIANSDTSEKKRKLWSDFHSMQTKEVPVLMYDPWGMFYQVFSEEKDLKCEDELFREYEFHFQLQFYRNDFKDDFIIEPWVTTTPVYANENDNWGTWGIENDATIPDGCLTFRMEEGHLTSPDEIDRLKLPEAIIDEKKTGQKYDKLCEAFGDTIEVVQDFSPAGAFGISYLLAVFFGPQAMLTWLCDYPDTIHQICDMIAKGAIKTYKDAEEKGHITNKNGTFGNSPRIQTMCYSNEIPNPDGPVRELPLDQTWFHTAAQEFEGVSPAMHNEFIIDHMKPFFELFGLVAYGCCENLGEKIDVLRRIKNLRRIAVTPWANLKKSAEQIGSDFVISWRPNPTDMVSNGFYPDRVKKIIKDAREIFIANDCTYEINLKDVITVDNDRDRIKNWVSVVREALAG